MRTADVRYLLTTKVPVRDREGKVFGIVGINRDVTEQEKARHRAAADRAPDAGDRG